MAREYFSHDHNSRNDLKMQKLQMKHGMKGVGVFWCIVEMLSEEDGYIMLSECERIAFELRTDSECISSVLHDFDLFEMDQKKFWSDSLLRRLNIKYAKSKLAKEAANARWNKMKTKELKHDNANAMQTHSERNTIKVNKSKVNEIKVKESIEERKVEFSKKILTHIESAYILKEDAIEFYNYWTEHGDNDRKMRFEKEKSFGIKQRLSTWLKNKEKFAPKRKETKMSLDEIEQMHLNPNQYNENLIFTDYKEIE